MISNFLDGFKTVRICQMFQKLRKTGFFGPKTPFSYISALIDPFYGLFGPFLTYLIHTVFSRGGTRALASTRD